MMRKVYFFSPFLSAGVSAFDNASVCSNLKEAFIFNLYLRAAFCAFGKFNRCIDVNVFIFSACRTLPFGNAKWHFFVKEIRIRNMAPVSVRNVIFGIYCDFFLSFEHHAASWTLFAVCKTFFSACCSFSFYLFRLMTESRTLCIRLRADFAAGAYKLILCRRRAGCRLLQYFGILVRMSLCGLRRAASYALAVGAVCVSESGNADCILRVASVSCACVCHYALWRTCRLSCNIARAEIVAECGAVLKCLRSDLAACAWEVINCGVCTVRRRFTVFISYVFLVEQVRVCGRGFHRAANALTVGIIDVLRLAAYLITTDTFVPVMSSVKRPGCFPCVNMRSKFICVYDIVCINHHVIFCAQRLNNCLDILFKTPVVGVLFVIHIGILLYDAFRKQFTDSCLRGRFHVGRQRNGIVSVRKEPLLLRAVTMKINVISFFGENEQVCGIFVSEDYIRQHFGYEVFRLNLRIRFIRFLY